MYKIYINTNDIIKKALMDLLINTDFEISSEDSCNIIISEQSISSNKPILILGADIALPLKFENLIQSISHTIERHNNNNPITFAGITLHSHNLSIDYNGQNYSLTEKEFGIFVALTKNKLSNKQLLETVWGYAKNTDSNTVATHINNIRRKISDDIIQTDNDNNYMIKGF